ncbi:excalibur calcium-binding domain-containing protein [Streptomyces sp. NPDC050842]|uniref:excalibur calcium-binding domain-containing protein n=1 Tax=Streptomyces sp. NPDC050842 TaxID=3365636 RepID=UPI0037A8004B
MTQPPPPGYGQPYGHPPFPPRFPSPVRRWWQHPALVVTALVVFPPGGIALTWLTRWSPAKKIVATVLAFLWFLSPFLLVDPPKEPTDDAKATPRPTATRTATTTPPASTSPSPSPSKSEAATMPTLVGGTYTAAEPLLTKNLGRAYAVYKDVKLPAAYGTWLVCFQRPSAGEPVSSMVPVVYLTAPDVPCPAAPDTVLHKPTPKPTTKPTQRPTPTPSRTTAPTRTPTPTRTPAPTPTEDGSGGGSVYYRNCTAVRAAGADPIRVGEPGYGRHLDRDGDGVACE